MDYAFCVTDAGRYLIARLLTGQVMHITKVLVGEGRIPDGIRLSSVQELFAPKAQATSDDPKCEDGVAYMTIEYNNSLNGGLETGFWLNEFGVFANDPVEGEVMIAYATLGDYPQWVSPYNSARGVDVKRFPVSIAIGEDVGMVVDYHTDLWLTWDDLMNNFNLTIMPLVDAEIDEKIKQHNQDPEAHFGFQRILNTKVYPRICLAEAMEEYSKAKSDSHVGYGNEYIVTFESLDSIVFKNYSDSADVSEEHYDGQLCRLIF